MVRSWLQGKQQRNKARIQAHVYGFTLQEKFGEFSLM